MKAAKRNPIAAKLADFAKAHNRARDWQTIAARMESSARVLAERFAEPIRDGDNLHRHPLNTGATAALAELENVRHAVDAGDADAAASAAMAAVAALWTAADAFGRTTQHAQGLTLWRGIVIDATPAEAVILNATARANAIDLPGDGDDVAAWTKATGSANRQALKVCIGKLNRRLKNIGLSDRFKLRGGRLRLT